MCLILTLPTPQPAPQQGFGWQVYAVRDGDIRTFSTGDLVPLKIWQTATGRTLGPTCVWSQVKYPAGFHIFPTRWIARDFLRVAREHRLIRDVCLFRVEWRGFITQGVVGWGLHQEAGKGYLKPEYWTPCLVAKHRRVLRRVS